MAITTAEVFRENIRRRLRELDWSQRQLASALEISEQSVSRLIGGAFVPTMDTADRVAAALQTTVQYLLTPVELPAEKISRVAS